MLIKMVVRIKVCISIVHFKKSFHSVEKESDDEDDDDDDELEEDNENSASIDGK